MPNPLKKTPIDVRSLARSHTGISIETLSGIAKSGTSEAARVTAAAILLDRGWGKAPQTHEHTGKDGDSEIRVILRTIIEGKK